MGLAILDTHVRDFLAVPCKDQYARVQHGSWHCRESIQESRTWGRTMPSHTPMSLVRLGYPANHVASDTRMVKCATRLFIKTGIHWHEHVRHCPHLLFSLLPSVMLSEVVI